MTQVEKTVFISYRRTNASWALAVSQNLAHHGYDVFFDFRGIASGDFERVIIENIKARAHFVVLLTPSALMRCADKDDWLRREIETALDTQRNIVPLMFEGFDFETATIASVLTGKLAQLKKYNALPVPVEYFEESMERLRERYLNVPLDAVLHPKSDTAQRAAIMEQVAANAAPLVGQSQLTAQELMERGTNLVKLRDFDGALRNFEESIRLDPNLATAYVGRGIIRKLRSDYDGALRDLDEGISLGGVFGYEEAYKARSGVHIEKRDFKAALSDGKQAVRLAPSDAEAWFYQGLPHSMLGDFESAVNDFNMCVSLDSTNSTWYFYRGVAHERTGNYTAAIADFQRSMDLGHDTRVGDLDLKQHIHRLKDHIKS